MLTKKYVLFIVEGKNDQIEIQAMLRAYCANSLQDKYVDIYLPYNGDITFDETEKTITGKLTEAVLSWRRGETRLHPFHPVSPSDVAKIIHVIDTDGAFIPEDAIIADDVGDVEYNEDGIRCGDRAFIVGRNRKKAKAIKKLLSVPRIDNIPYEVFFVSCNMDHVLFGTRNPASKSKGPNARYFAAHCKSPDDLSLSVFGEGIRFDGPFPESWSFIQVDMNSLNRHTNLNLLLKDLSE